MRGLGFLKAESIGRFHWQSRTRSHEQDPRHRWTRVRYLSTWKHYLCWRCKARIRINYRRDIIHWLRNRNYDCVASDPLTDLVSEATFGSWVSL